MAFKNSKSARFDWGKTEVVASAFTLSDGTQVSSATKGAAITALTAVATPDASDLATAITLVNALKVKVNAIIAALQA